MRSKLHNFKILRPCPAYFSMCQYVPLELKGWWQWTEVGCFVLLCFVSCLPWKSKTPTTLSQFLRFFWKFQLSIKPQSLGTTGLDDFFVATYSDYMKVTDTLSKFSLNLLTSKEPKWAVLIDHLFHFLLVSPSGLPNQFLKLTIFKTELLIFNSPPPPKLLLPLCSPSQ